MKIRCSNCGANLKFVPSIQKIICEHCGGKIDVEDFKYNDDFYEDCEEYTCKSCGADLLTFEKTGVVRCIYCGGKEFVKGKVNKEYILQGIIPFKVDKKQFIKIYEEYLRKLPDVDKKFKKKIPEAKVTNLYIPYSFANNFFRKQYSEELNELLEEIVPFDFKELKDMNPIYLDDCLAETIKTKKEENDIKTKDGSFFWVPIFMAEIEYENKKYYIVMNGQTCETVGGGYVKLKRKYKIGIFMLSVFLSIIIMDLAIIGRLILLSGKNIIMLLFFVICCIPMISLGVFSIIACYNIVEKQEKETDQINKLRKIHINSKEAKNILNTIS